MLSCRTSCLARVAAGVLLLFLASSASADTLDPGDPNDPTDCGVRAVADDALLSYFTGDLDLCVVGNITISAPDGVVADFLQVDAPVDFNVVESEFGFSNQFLPPPDTPLVALVLGDAYIDWGAARGNVRLVATGDVAFVVPEPGTAGLLLGGLLALVGVRVRGPSAAR